MKLAIIDPGFHHPEGHHQAVNMGIGSSFSKSGIETVIFSSKRIDPRSLISASKLGINLIPFFNTACYLVDVERLSPEIHRAVADSYFNELVALVESPSMNGVTSLYFHTGHSCHLLALGEMLKRGNPRTPKNVVVTLMFPPSARLQGEYTDIWDPREYFRYKMAFNNLVEASKENGIKIHIATSCRSYQRIYQTFWPLSPIEVHPIINQGPAWEKLEQFSPIKNRVLLYLGIPRENKGIKFSSSICLLASQRFRDAQFVFHYMPDFPGAKSQFEPLISNLRSASRKVDNILIQEGFLEPDSYQSLVQSCDVVAILYDPTWYKFKTSGVFWDALNLNKHKWLVTKDTWLPNELSELRIPHSMVTYGHVDEALLGLDKLLGKDLKSAQHNEESPVLNKPYFDLLTSSFTDWLVAKVKTQEATESEFSKAA